MKLRFNPLNAELKPISHFMAILGAHPMLHISGVRVKLPGNGYKKPGSLLLYLFLIINGCCIE
jgi:hypothetical protein